MTDRVRETLEEVSDRYPERGAALLPVLHAAQAMHGWLSPETLEHVSETLGVPKATVKGVATFYALYRHQPTGRHLIQLCTNVSCMLFGAETFRGLLEKQYGLVPGGTSADGRFSLVIMECIGACDRAPAMLVNDDLHGNLTSASIGEILEHYR